MANYQSRHRPRRHTTLAGKIKDNERYDRFYDMTCDATQRGQFPHLTLTTGRLVARVMKGPHDPRAIPPGSSMNTDNRFSGPRLDGRPGQGALYVGTVAGVLREHAHYSLLPPPGALQKAAPLLWKPGATDRTNTFIQRQRAGAPPPDPASKFYLLRVEHPLRFADLRVTSLAPFMSQLRAGGDGAKRYGIVSASLVDFQIAAASAPEDYSASRGIADAVFDQRGVTSDAGVCAFSSRADMDSGIVLFSDDDPTGGLVFAIFGPDSSVVSALRPIARDQTQVGFDTYAELRGAIL